MEKKTIEQIIEIEPMLQKVFDRAKEGYKEGFEDWKLYTSCKKEATLLVGSFCRNIDLANSQDYVTVINEITRILNL